MTSVPTVRLKPRKQPSQARSQVTVEAVFEATIQVLLAVGSQRLTTTRVAERAGVSVGTLYQYFPNKQSLLFGLLQRHLDRITREVEEAARSVHARPVKTMASTVVHAFLRAKTERIEESRALYAVSSELDCVALVQAAGQRSCKAIASMLETAPDGRFPDPQLTAFVLANAMVGPIRAALEGNFPVDMLGRLSAHLEALSTSYLENTKT